MCLCLLALAWAVLGIILSRVSFFPPGSWGFSDLEHSKALMSWARNPATLQSVELLLLTASVVSSAEMQREESSLLFLEGLCLLLHLCSGILEGCAPS